MVYIYKNSKGKVRLSKSKPKGIDMWIKMSDDGTIVTFFVKGKQIIRNYEKEKRYNRLLETLWENDVYTEAFILFNSDIAKELGIQLKALSLNRYFKPVNEGDRK